MTCLFVCTLTSLQGCGGPCPPSPGQRQFLILFIILGGNGRIVRSVGRFLSARACPERGCSVTITTARLSRRSLIALLRVPIGVIIPSGRRYAGVCTVRRIVRHCSPRRCSTVAVFGSSGGIIPGTLRLFGGTCCSKYSTVRTRHVARGLGAGVTMLGTADRRVGGRLFHGTRATLKFSSTLVNSNVVFSFRVFRRVTPELSKDSLTGTARVRLLGRGVCARCVRRVIYCYGGASSASKCDGRHRH